MIKILTDKKQNEIIDNAVIIYDKLFKTAMECDMRSSYNDSIITLLPDFISAFNDCFSPENRIRLYTELLMRNGNYDK